jgi:hypothetical protein
MLKVAVNPVLAADQWKILGVKVVVSHDEYTRQFNHFDYGWPTTKQAVVQKSN